MAEYLNVDEVDALAAELCGAIDQLKYLCGIKADHEDAKFKTKELQRAFEDLKGACEDYIGPCEYYLKKYPF